jgi:hypothetical protein
MTKKIYINKKGGLFGPKFRPFSHQFSSFLPFSDRFCAFSRYFRPIFWLFRAVFAAPAFEDPAAAHASQQVMQLLGGPIVAGFY